MTSQLDNIIKELKELRRDQAILYRSGMNEYVEGKKNGLKCAIDRLEKLKGELTNE